MRIKGLNEYQELAMRTKNSNLDTKEGILEAALGISGEAGEVTDLIKKWYCQDHKLFKLEVAKEVGDVLWYCARMADALGMDLEMIASKNIEKLKNRYPEGFSSENSVGRTE